MPIQHNRDSKLLFIGDSITDVGRRNDPEEMGHGYVRLIRDTLLCRDPANAPTIINRGIGGNRVTHLAERWEADCLAHEPDLVSIKIGINDVWHNLGGKNEGVPLEVFRPTYESILTQLRERLPDCQLVLCEPSVIWPPAPAGGNEGLQPYIASVHELAAKFDAVCVVPLHGTFIEAQAARPDVHWTDDGVHPTSTGHMLIARTWLETTGA